MLPQSRVLLLAAVTSLFGAALSAQKLLVEDRLTAGSDTVITYSDPGRAGTTITVKVDGGYPPITVEIQIHLDEHGQGSVTWTVPDWYSAHFNAPGVTELTRLIMW